MRSIRDHMNAIKREGKSGSAGDKTGDQNSWIFWDKTAFLRDHLDDDDM